MTMDHPCTCTSPFVYSCLCSHRVTARHFLFFFFNDTATTEIYTLSLHDALPIFMVQTKGKPYVSPLPPDAKPVPRSEEHTSELQSLTNLVCRLLLEKKKTAPHVRGYYTEAGDELKDTHLSEAEHCRRQ